MEAKAFTKLFKAKLNDKLIKYFGKKLDTKKPMLLRESYAITFYAKVLNSFGEVLTDYNIAGYKLDDFHDSIVKGTVEKEQKRLMDDIDNCENIVLFIVDKFVL